jgi:hypothetical protein
MDEIIPTKMTLRPILRENAALVVMYVLGTVLTLLLWWPLAVIYLGYALLSNILYMARVCAYCAHYSAATCHAGYHLFSGRRFHAKEGRDFAGQFRRNVVLLFPGWFVPPIAGVYLLYKDMSWLVATVMVVFLLVGFVILPRDSQRYCEGCENEGCPRRRKGVAERVERR